MKVLIPTKSENKEQSVAGVFGRSPFFAIYDTDNQELIYKKNPGPKHSKGAGIKASQFAIDEKIDKVIVKKIGPRAIDVLESEGIEIEKLKNPKKTVLEITNNL